MPISDQPPSLRSRLDALAERMRAALDAVHADAELEAVRVAYLGRSGEITLVRRSIGTLPPAERPGAGKIDQRGGRRRWKRDLAARRTAIARRRARCRARDGDRRHVSRHRAASRARCIRCAGRSRTRSATSSAAASPCCSAPRSRPRSHLRRAEHPGRPPGARRLRFVVPARRSAAAPAHVADADPRDARAPAADRDRRPGHGLPARRGRRAPLLHVPSDRRLARRARDPLGAPQGHARRDVPRAVRAGAASAFPAVLLPVHRTERRDRHDLPRLRRRRLPDVRRLGLDRDRRQRDGPSERVAQRRLRSRGRSAAGRSAWGSSASRWSATASTTSACSSKTIRRSWSSWL